MTMRTLAAIGLALLSLGSEATAQDIAPDEAPGEALRGFWVVDPKGMEQRERFAETLESEEGRAGVGFVGGVLFEFSPDGMLRTHMGRVDARAVTITPGEDGRLHVQAEGAPEWFAEVLDDSHFVQSFAERDQQILWRRTWSPLAGSWIVDRERLAEEAWYVELGADEADAMRGTIDAMRVTIRDDGAFEGSLISGEATGRIVIESTTPPAGALLDAGGKPLGHLVRREGGAALYLDSRTYPLERRNPPSKVVLGRWMFDVERAIDLEWVQRATPPNQTVRDFITNNVNLEEVIEITPTTWRTLPYKVVDERGNQFAVEAEGTIPFWVRIEDGDHFSQMGGFGREFPFVRANDEPIPASE